MSELAHTIATLAQFAEEIEATALVGTVRISTDNARLILSAALKTPGPHRRPNQCPFCRAPQKDSTVIKLTTEKASGYAVECHGCHTTGPIKPTEADAELAWDSSHNLTVQLGVALQRIREARDFHAEHGRYPVGVATGDKCFDDWAADLADEALKEE